MAQGTLDAATTTTTVIAVFIVFVSTAIMLKNKHSTFFN
jgi:hypothetical protein